MSDVISAFNITSHGLTFIAEVVADEGAGYPWDNDITGPVRQASRWRSRRADQPEKNPGEVHLGNGWLYDFAEATRIVKRDGWGLSPEELATTSTLGAPYSRARIARAAVIKDMERLRAWVRGEWSYVGVNVELVDIDGNGTGLSDATWGIESDGPDSHEETAAAIAEDICSTLGEAEQITHVTVGARTHRVRSDAALAATGKQQGGETQTNTPAHERISSVTARLRQCGDGEAAELIELMYAAGVEAEQEILAARQTVGQGDAESALHRARRALAEQCVWGSEKRACMSGELDTSVAIKALVSVLAVPTAQAVELIAKRVGDYRVTVAEDTITVSHGRDIVFAYSAGDPEPINARQTAGQP